MECKRYTHFDEILGINQKVQCKTTQKRTLVGAVFTVIGMIVVIILVTDTSKDASKINSGKILRTQHYEPLLIINLGF